jgi:3-oxoacyl-[acyl-carrier protein] reductase
MTQRQIIVTGAGSGIGLGCVRRLRENGHVVAALDIATDALETAYADDATVVREHLDAGSPESCRKSVATAADQLGGLDAIIHCAAIWSGTTWDQSDAAEWDRILSVNLRGSFLIAQAAAEKMINRGGGSIVLTASDSARVGGVAGGPAYAAS